MLRSETQKARNLIHPLAEDLLLANRMRQYPFDSGAILPDINFTRGSGASFFDHQNIMRISNANQPRIHQLQDGCNIRGIKIEPSSTNHIANSTLAEANIGSPGQLPNGWAMGGADGLTREIKDIGTIGSLPYIDIRYFGSYNKAGTIIILNNSLTGIAAARDETWTGSQYIQLVGGSLDNINLIVQSIIMRRSDGSYIREFGIDKKDHISSKLTRLSITYKLQEIDTAFTQLYNYITYKADKLVDFTLRFAGFQMEKASFASSYIASNGSATTRAADICSINLDEEEASWFNQNEGTFYIQFKTENNSGASSYILSCSDGTPDERIDILQDSQTIHTQNITGGIRNVDLTKQITTNHPVKIAFAYKENDFAMVLTAGPVIEHKNASLAKNLSKIMLGSSYNNINQLNGIISDFRYYPIRLPNTRLQDEVA